MITDVVPSPHSSSCVLLSSIMFLAAGWATSISRKMAFPSFVSLVDRFNIRRKEKRSDVQDASHRVQDHLQHCFGTKTSSYNVRNSLKRTISRDHTFYQKDERPLRQLCSKFAPFARIAAQALYLTQIIGFISLLLKNGDILITKTGCAMTVE